MAKYFLLNHTNVGNHLKRAGEIIDDTLEPIAPIQASGGHLISDGYAGAPILLAATVLIREQGWKDQRAETQMLAAAAEAAILNGGGGGGGGGWTAMTSQLVNGSPLALTNAMLGNLILADNNAAARGLTLQGSPTEGFFCFVRILNVAPATFATNTLTLTPSGGLLLEGGAGARVIDNGTGFFILAYTAAGGWRMGPLNQNLVVMP